MIEAKDWDGRTCVLRHVVTGEPIVRGQKVKLHDGVYEVSGGRAPHKEASTGRVWVQDARNKSEREFFPSVIDAKWVLA